MSVFRLYKSAICLGLHLYHLMGLRSAMVWLSAFIDISLSYHAEAGLICIFEGLVVDICLQWGQLYLNLLRLHKLDIHVEARCKGRSRWENAAICPPELDVMVNGADSEQNKIYAVHGDDLRRMIRRWTLLHEVDAKELVAHVLIAQLVLEKYCIGETMHLHGNGSRFCCMAQRALNRLVYSTLGFARVSRQLVCSFFNLDLDVEIDLEFYVLEGFINLSRKAMRKAGFKRCHLLV